MEKENDGRYLKLWGRTMSIESWCILAGITKGLYFARRKAGWTAEDAFLGVNSQASRKGRKTIESSEAILLIKKEWDEQEEQRDIDRARNYKEPKKKDRFIFRTSEPDVEWVQVSSSAGYFRPKDPEAWRKKQEEAKNDRKRKELKERQGKNRLP